MTHLERTGSYRDPRGVFAQLGPDASVAARRHLPTFAAIAALMRGMTRVSKWLL